MPRKKQEVVTTERPSLRDFFAMAVAPTILEHSFLAEPKLKRIVIARQIWRMADAIMKERK